MVQNNQNIVLMFDSCEEKSYISCHFGKKPSLLTAARNVGAAAE